MVSQILEVLEQCWRGCWPEATDYSGSGAHEDKSFLEEIIEGDIIEVLRCSDSWGHEDESLQEEIRGVICRRSVQVSAIGIINYTHCFHGKQEKIWGLALRRRNLQEELRDFLNCPGSGEHEDKRCSLQEEIRGVLDRSGCGEHEDNSLEIEIREVLVRSDSVEHEGNRCCLQVEIRELLGIRSYLEDIRYWLNTEPIKLTGFGIGGNPEDKMLSLLLNRRSLQEEIIEVLNRYGSDKRWSLQKEIIKVLNCSVKHTFPEEEDEELHWLCFDQEEELKWFETQKGEPAVYNCLNVLTIWSKFREHPEWYPDVNIKVPKDIGVVIKNNLLELAPDMIQNPSIHDVGFVAFSLSRKWLAQSIHKMLKDGIDTWAPKLPVERVMVAFPSLDEKVHPGLFRRHAIANSLIHMLMYSKVAVFKTPTPRSGAFKLPKRLGELFSIKESDSNVVIYVENKPPFILAKGDLEASYVDLETLWYGSKVCSADWIVYLTPVRQQEYIEMCFIAANLEGWIRNDMEGKWNPSSAKEYPVLSYAGYRANSTKDEELANLFDQVRACCDVVARDADIQLLGYTAEAVFNCVLIYTCLKNHRLDADCTFNLDEMVKAEGNTFVYLLRIRAKVQRITNDSREGIIELKDTSDLILENCEGREEGLERMLEFHLLKFTESLEEASLFVVSHVMCDYLYDLSKKFESYNDCVHMRGAETSSRLLLCEATAVVMEKCFHLLRITPEFNGWPFNSHELPLDEENKLKKYEIQKMVEKKQMDEKDGAIASIDPSLLTGLRKDFITPCIVSDASEPPRNSRFEVFSIRPIFPKDSMFETGYLFGMVSVSDKFGLRSKVGYSLYEADSLFVPLFNHQWYEPVNLPKNRVVHLENYRSVPFSSSVEVCMELHACTEKKDACFQLCSEVSEIDLKDFWAEKSNSKIGRLNLIGNDGRALMHYILMKDAVDTSLEIRFEGEKYRDREVHGHIYASYGEGFSYDCPDLCEGFYQALLFSNYPDSAQMPLTTSGILPLRRSVLAVPKNSSLLINVLLVDAETQDVILVGCENFIPPTEEGSNTCIIRGEDCILHLKVDWKK